MEGEEGGEGVGVMWGGSYVEVGRVTLGGVRRGEWVGGEGVWGWRG